MSLLRPFGFAIKNCTLISWVSNFWGAVYQEVGFYFLYKLN
ncbi:hypothetical protein A1YG_05041 [Escherichia coli KTE130]|nr:hypothetical protein A1YG_05041 [Escherichia coli KTE130]